MEKHTSNSLLLLCFVILLLVAELHIPAFVLGVFTAAYVIAGRVE